MIKHPYLLAALAAVSASFVALACSSSDSSSSSGTSPSSSASSSSSDEVDSGVAANNCVAKGAKGNEKGVGAYCDNQTSCPSGTLCTTLGGASVPKDHIFCTLLCSDDSVCGTGAYCDKSNGAGSGCVPNECGNPPAADGGTDSGAMDASDQ